MPKAEVFIVLIIEKCRVWLSFNWQAMPSPDFISNLFRFELQTLTLKVFTQTLYISLEDPVSIAVFMGVNRLGKIDDLNIAIPVKDIVG